MGLMTKSRANSSLGTITRIVCETKGCGAEFENQTLHKKISTKRFCDRCVEERKREYARERGRKRKALK